MKIGISIRKRIYLSFFLLVSLFVLNAILTVVTLNKVKEMSNHLSKVIDPSIQALDDFNRMLLQSKMNSTNWVFLRASQEDKDQLRKLHDTDYKILKERLSGYAKEWGNKSWVDSLHKVYTGFEQLLTVEKDIMGTLTTFSNYDDPVIKFDAERKIEEEVLPRTAELMSALNNISDFSRNIRRKENDELEQSSMNLRAFIVILAIVIICIGLFLSLYMTKVIITPVNKIRNIVSDLGKGITRQIEYPGSSRNEIGQMIYSVNNLSENLQRTARFAHAIGLRDFDIPFQPLSDEDTLGKALLAMRDNLKISEKSLLERTSDLIQRNKDLEQFTFIVSHNLRAPVANIMGLSHVLNVMGKEMDITQQHKLLGELATAVKKLDDIIIDLNRILQVRGEREEKNV